MKQRMQGVVIGILATVLLLGTVTAFANTQTVTRQITYGIGVILNGQTVDFDEDSRPFVMDGRTFLPLRTLAELLGLPVDFDPVTNMTIVGTPPAGQPTAVQPPADPIIATPPDNQGNEQTSPDSPYPQLDGLWLHVHSMQMELDANAIGMSINFDGNSFTAVHYYHPFINLLVSPARFDTSRIGYTVNPSDLHRNPGYAFNPRFPWVGRQANNLRWRGCTREFFSDENLWRITTTGTFSLQHVSGRMFRITFNFADGTNLQEHFFYNEGARSTIQIHPLTFVRY